MEEKKETPPPPPPIIDQLKEYAETRLKLAKYEVIDKSSSVLASVITDIIIAVTLTLTFLFFSFALAFYVSGLLHSYCKGFGCVALLYLLISVVIILAKDKFEKPLINLFIKKIFK
jgi:hypothetical protein